MCASAGGLVLFLLPEAKGHVHFGQRPGALLLPEAKGHVHFGRRPGALFVAGGKGSCALRPKAWCSFVFALLVEAWCSVGLEPCDRYWTFGVR
jgi:hypothetical protein